MMPHDVYHSLHLRLVTLIHFFKYYIQNSNHNIRTLKDPAASRWFVYREFLVRKSESMYTVRVQSLPSSRYQQSDSTHKQIYLTTHVQPSTLFHVADVKSGIRIVITIMFLSKDIRQTTCFFVYMFSLGHLVHSVSVYIYAT